MSIFTSWVTSPGGRRPLELELPVAPAAPSTSTVESEEGLYVDAGMEIPESYGIDIVRALVQDPFHLMVYWEIRPESYSAIQGLFPHDAVEAFRPFMRLTDLDAGDEAYVEIPLAGKYWFSVNPSSSFRIDVGALSSRFGFVPIVRSNVVHTPAGTVSTAVDEDPQFRVDTPRFVKLLAVTGFATDRVLTDVARAEAAMSAGLPMPEFVSQPSPALIDAFSRLPETVRHAAVHVADGESLTRSEIDQLPASLRLMLERLLASGEYDAELLTAAFMHLLPQLLRNALDGGILDDPAHPFHLPPRFVTLGSSDQLQRPHVDWSWMPSMAESLTRRPPVIAPDVLDTVPTA
ncbi:MAG: DUF4912 domain-containing protein [Blastocatellia bacterium]